MKNSNRGLLAVMSAVFGIMIYRQFAYSADDLAETRRFTNQTESQPTSEILSGVKVGQKGYRIYENNMLILMFTDRVNQAGGEPCKVTEIGPSYIAVEALVLDNVQEMRIPVREIAAVWIDGNERAPDKLPEVKPAKAFLGRLGVGQDAHVTSNDDGSWLLQCSKTPINVMKAKPMKVVEIAADYIRFRDPTEAQGDAKVAVSEVRVPLSRISMAIFDPKKE